MTAKPRNLSGVYQLKIRCALSRTDRVLIARALLDNASFISERLVHSLALPRTSQSIRVFSRSVCLELEEWRNVSQTTPIQSITKFEIYLSNELIDVTAPKVTCDLPIKSVAFDLQKIKIRLPIPDLGDPVGLTYCSELTYLWRY